MTAEAAPWLLWLLWLFAMGFAAGYMFTIERMRRR